MRSRETDSWGSKRSLAELAEGEKPNPQHLQMRDGNECEKSRMCEVADVEGPGGESNCQERERRLVVLAEAEK